MTRIDFADAVRSGARLYGTLAVSGAPQFFDATVGLGLDFVFLDTEHITYNNETLSWMCRAYREAGIAPLVRILAPDPFMATRAIDSGAQGILAPYVEEIDDVVALVGAVKHRPLKGAGLRRVLTGESLGERTMSYVAAQNRERVLFVNIESPTAVERLDEILAVPGVDGAIIGPHDLSVSSGMPEEYSSAPFRELVGMIMAKTRSKGLSAGCHSGFPGAVDEQLRWIAAGANIVLHSADVIFFRERARDDFAAIRNALGDGGAKPARPVDHI